MHEQVGPVVVGLEGGPNDRDALRAAFQEAELSEQSLAPVHVTEYGFLERADVQRLVAAEQHRHPGVAVKVRLVRGDPTDMLVACSGKASLVVLGSRGRHEAAGLVLGSVSQGVLRRAMCPVRKHTGWCVVVPQLGETVRIDG
ncbi:universal stress protein [Flexivirga alba]|uniref:Universal stress protein n=1 Tax=Flexivirga alba TaxID=702742 RepID=A0ABW2AK26_9MICO